MNGSQKNAQGRALNTALEYLEKGFSVIRFQAYWPDPAKRGDEKRPLGEWGRYQTELPTEADLRSWFSKPAGIGLVCGPVSGGLVVFDFEAEEVWLRFERQAREAGLSPILDEAPTVRSPNGVHLWLIAPQPVAGFAIYDPSIQTNKKAAGLIAEVRATDSKGGGQLVIAPGGHPDAHPSGKPYEWISPGWMMDKGSPRTLDGATFSQLLAILKAMDKGKPNAPKKVANKPALETEDKPHTAARFNGSTTWEELLEADGWKKTKGPFNHDKYGPGTCEWLRPGKEGAGCSATTSADGLYVFSSSTSLPTDKRIDRFGYLAYTQFGGDFTKTAAHLHKKWDEQDLSSLLGEADEDLPATTSKMAPFPVHCLPRIVAEFVEAHSVALSKDPVFVALPALVVLAGAIGRSRRFEIDQTGWVTQAVLWGLLVSPPTSGKSVGLNKAADPLSDLDDEWQAQNKERELEYQKELAEWEKKENKDGEPKPQPPKKRRLVVQDFTLECIVPILEDNPAGLILVEDEFSTIMERVCRYNRDGSVAEFIKFKNNSGSLKNDRVGRSTSIKNPTMSMVGTIQPKALPAIFTDKLKQKGWPQRWFLAMPPARVRLYGDSLPTIPRGVNEAWAGLIKDLALGRYGLNQEPVSILYGQRPDSWALWSPFHDAWVKRAALLNAKGREDEAERIGKFIEDTARLALILQTVEDRGSSDPWATEAQQRLISGPVMQAAITLGEWFFNEGSRVHAIVEGVAHTDEMGVIIKAIQAHGGETGVTARTIQKNHKARWKEAKEVLAILEQMEKKGVVKRVNKKPGSKGGPPAVFWLLNDD